MYAIRSYYASLGGDCHRPGHGVLGCKKMAVERGLFGQLASARTPDFGMTVLALRTAAFANGVSRLHAETSRRMWQDLWPGLLV